MLAGANADACQCDSDARQCDELTFVGATGLTLVGANAYLLGEAEDRKRYST